MLMQRRISFTRDLLFVVISLCLLLVSTSGSAWAGSHDNDSVMAYVNSAPGSWYTGKIDSINKDVVCIADVNRWFAKDVIFVSRYGFKISRRNFYKGKEVRILINPKYKCSILIEI